MISTNLLKRIVLPVLLLISATVFGQQNIKVTGRVTDSKDGSGLAGVSVLVKGTNNGTSTDADGNYTISAPLNSTLVLSSIGFGLKEVKVTGGEINASISATASSQLNEVVVVGYGTAKKKDLTGSVALVTSKDFVKGPITTPDQLIAGKVAGVQITPNGGNPGAGSRIRIRGGTSLNASNDPLIVIDGVPVDNNGISGSPNPLSLINPNDIESFNILKDASAAAIYGSRAANGVIIITTKRGRKGDKLRVNFTTLNSVSAKRGESDVLSASEFSDFVRANGKAADIALLGDQSTDWQDIIYRPAFASDNNISFSGGLKSIPYRLSFGYLNQDGILRTDNLQRTNVSLNLSPKFLNDHLTVNINTKYSNSQSHFADGGAIGSAVGFDPTQKIFSNDVFRFFQWQSAPGQLNTNAAKNPLGLIQQQDNNSNVNRFIGNVQLDYKLPFLPDLKANLNLGYDYSKGRGTIFIPAYAATGFTRVALDPNDKSKGGTNNEYEQEKKNKLLEVYLNYTKDVKAIRSRVDLTAGYSWQDWLTMSPSFADRLANGAIANKAGQPFQTQNTLVSFFGRVNYALMDRYLITATMRRDGSSRFGPDYRWGNFPSAAVAWKIIDEPFMKTSKVFSDLKLRLGWGITGQQDGIGDYAYQPNFNYGDSAARYQFGNQFYTIARPDGYVASLKWEETESRNIGLDFGFYDNRITFSTDYYEKETSDLLAVVPTAAGTNFTNEVLTNIGSISNKGLEFTLGLNPIRTKDFSLDLGFNYTHIIENDITKLQLVNDPKYLGAATGGAGGFNTVQINSVGYRPRTFFLYKQIYDKTGKPIEGLYEDKNRDGIINDLDKYWTKNAEATAFMGFTASATYKKLTGGFVLRSSIGNYMYNDVKAGRGTVNSALTNLGYLNNPNREVLKSGFVQQQTWSDYYLENASFVRMDNAYLTYSVGKVFHDKANLRLNASCQNVFVITKYEGLDPEIAGGIDNTIYPRPRMYALGINLDF
ncbi:MAG: TonB-dependent receptor [Bacteroidota bacterium]